MSKLAIENNNQQHRGGLAIWLILSVCIIVPFANDVFIPAFPQMQIFFNTSHIQLMITVFLVGLAIAQPIYGPMSDRFGRKPVLLFGLILYVLGGLSTVLVTDIRILLLARFVQALGAASAIISAFAISRDVFPQNKMIKASSVIMAMISICPAIAPLFGSVLTVAGGWRAPLIYLLLLGLVFLIVILCFMKETNVKPNMTAIQPSTIFNNYKILFKNINYVKYCSVSGLSYGVLFSYFSIAPLFIITKFGFHLIDFGIIVACNALVITFASLIVPKFSGKYPLLTIMLLGCLSIIIGGFFMLVWNLIATASIYSFMIPMLVVTLGVGLIRPTASAGAMTSAAKEIAGSAAAGFNLLSFLGGAASTFILSFLVHTPLQFSIMVIIWGCCAVFVIATKKQGVRT